MIVGENEENTEFKKEKWIGFVIHSTIDYYYTAFPSVTFNHPPEPKR